MRENKQPGQRHGDHARRENHGLSGGGGGVGNGVGYGHIFAEFFAEPRYHEQPIVDGKAQPQQCDHGLRKYVDLRLCRKDRQHTQRPQDGQDAHDQGHTCGNYGAKDKQQEDRYGGECVDFSAPNVAGHAFIQGVGNGGGSSDADGNAVGQCPVTGGQ